ncbi:MULTISPECIES: VTT domain-containing protein [Paraburkholderia]|uniref:VTT domain-containing protein n=1 Tax=Paraburkholderia TaxID=1822464 RepID=UPI001B2AE2B4|nr:MULTISPECIES: VTT domain-containing protein [Paraburkholderia]MCX4139489.1 VTT domain-containing protein [Paraburkholderia aspalathi]MCX4155487.1 VTT domain-containing protein [Paraburkholderia aspalathi]MDN7164895.1 VTT domain-containing protein [Paraburkholderia sp. SECH2]MDN7172176.1 VTT domain-containing protein [Paraburkholderia sp. SEWSISQ10-3 4]MDQ6393381.1 VTT domain-containing protein [Paraburkholderia aspalathi]
MWHFPVAIPPSLGVWAVFMSVLVTQLGLPIPAAPMLILGGTMAAMGQTSYASVIGAAVCATLLADSLWFFTGRAYGRRLLNQLVRFSLSLDTTVRVARNTYERYGAPILTVAKFLPGLGLISAPLLGTTPINVGVFLLWDFVGAMLWASVWVIGGAALDDQIVQLVLLVRHHGGTIFDAFAAIFLAVLVYRYVRRWQFRRWLAHIRISPDQLDEMMRSNEPPLILDARPHSIRAKESHRIAGAQLLDLDSPEPLHPDLLKRPIVVYCVCPNEATAKRIVNQLHRKNIHHVRALKGGLDAWEKRGYPVEPLPPDFETAMAHMAEDEGNEGEYTVRARLAK